MILKVSNSSLIPYKRLGFILPNFPLKHFHVDHWLNPMNQNIQEPGNMEEKTQNALSSSPFSQHN